MWNDNNDHSCNLFRFFPRCTVQSHSEHTHNTFVSFPFLFFFFFLIPTADAEFRINFDNSYLCFAVGFLTLKFHLQNKTYFFFCIQVHSLPQAKRTVNLIVFFKVQ